MCPVGLCKTQNIEGGARQRIVAAGSSQLHQFNKVGQNLVSGCSVQPTVEIPSCTTLRFLSFCAELSVKVGDTRTPGLPVKSGSGNTTTLEHDVLSLRSNTHQLVLQRSAIHSGTAKWVIAQIGRRLVRLLKTGSRQEEGGMGLPFHLCGGILF